MHRVETEESLKGSQRNESRLRLKDRRDLDILKTAGMTYVNGKSGEIKPNALPNFSFSPVFPFYQMLEVILDYLKGHVLNN